MKIAFWSNARGSCGVTSNLACISVASALEHSGKAVLLENHNQKNNLEQVLMYNGISNRIQEDLNYSFKPIGMSHILNHFTLCDNKYYDNSETRSTDYGTRVIKEASLEVLRGSLYYIPADGLMNKDIFEYDLYGKINNILTALDAMVDITYIDTSNSNNLSTKVILEEADLVVVNLIQNSNVIQDFFNNYASLICKCVFLISEYHKKSELNLKSISKLHSIKKSQIASIPYNCEYQEAVNHGRIIEFLSRNYSCKRKNPNYEFVTQVKKAVEMIMNHQNNIQRKEACL